MSTDEALEELRSNSGTQFDANVVDALCAVIAERETVTPQAVR
jgi:HD-GYP domain-containing protein (c-di-GMP phosphodiesterase class II)